MREKKYYGPGIWAEADGSLHISAREILAHLKLSDTPENRYSISLMAEEVLREEFPGLPITQAPEDSQ